MEKNHWDGIHIQQPSQGFSEKDIHWAIVQVLPIDMLHNDRIVKVRDLADQIVNKLKEHHVK